MVLFLGPGKIMIRTALNHWMGGSQAPPATLRQIATNLDKSWPISAFFLWAFCGWATTPDESRQQMKKWKFNSLKDKAYGEGLYWLVASFPTVSFFCRRFFVFPRALMHHIEVVSEFCQIWRLDGCWWPCFRWIQYSTCADDRITLDFVVRIPPPRVTTDGYLENH